MSTSAQRRHVQHAAVDAEAHPRIRGVCVLPPAEDPHDRWVLEFVAREVDHRPSCPSVIHEFLATHDLASVELAPQGPDHWQVVAVA